MRGEYKLFRVYKGRPAFAWVWVDVNPLPDSSELVVKDRIKHADISEGEISAEINSTWIDAAMIGARKVLAYLVDRGQIKGGWQAQISKLVGTPVDTDPAAIECAASLATWRAILPDAPEPILRYDKKWHIDLDDSCLSPD
jgi:hypothetical protein